MNKEEQIKILNSVLYRPWIEISDNERETIETLFNNLQFELDQTNKKLDEIKEYCNEKLKWNRDDGNDYWAGKNNAQQQVSKDILSIIDGSDE